MSQSKMNTSLFQFIHISNHTRRMLRFGAVGLLNTAFGYFLTIALYHLLIAQLNLIYIGVICNFISITFSFLTNKLFVFKSKANWIVQYLKSYLVYGVVGFASIFILYVLVTEFEWTIWISQAISMFMAAVLSYVGNAFITFKHRK